MSYKALYRTYRPSTFDQVAGQQHIVKTLMNALKENKIAHAYLFCGPRGTGKTSMARLFAKSLNCEHGFGSQCNECPNCLAVKEGSHPDIIEMDAQELMKTAENNWPDAFCEDGISEVVDQLNDISNALNGNLSVIVEEA